MNWDKRLRAETALPNRHVRVDAQDVSAYYDIKTDYLDASKINLGEFIKRAQLVSATGTFSSYASFDLSTTISYNTPHADLRMGATPYVAVYQGTAIDTDEQIFPTLGANVTAGRYDVTGAFNYDGWNGTQSRWSCILTDTNGTSTQAFHFVARWVYPDYRTGAGDVA